MRYAIKKLFSLVIIVMICLTSSVSAFAADASSSTNQTSKIEISTFTNDFINQEIQTNIPGITWKKSTSISEIIPTYDLNEYVNGYIINLSTEGKPTGYILVSYDDTYYIDEFGFDGVYSISGQPVTNQSTLGKQKLIYTGNADFLTPKDNAYYYLNDNVKLTLTKAEINKIYQQNKKNTYAYREAISSTITPNTSGRIVKLNES